MKERAMQHFKAGQWRASNWIFKARFIAFDVGEGRSLLILPSCGSQSCQYSQKYYCVLEISVFSLPPGIFSHHTVRILSPGTATHLLQAVFLFRASGCRTITTFPLTVWKSGFQKSLHTSLCIPVLFLSRSEPPGRCVHFLRGSCPCLRGFSHFQWYCFPGGSELSSCLCYVLNLAGWNCEQGDSRGYEMLFF